MWKTIFGGKIWQSEIKNRKKDASHYRVDMTITPPSMDEALYAAKKEGRNRIRLSRN